MFSFYFLIFFCFWFPFCFGVFYAYMNNTVLLMAGVVAIFCSVFLLHDLVIIYIAVEHRLPFNHKLIQASLRSVFCSLWLLLLVFFYTFGLGFQPPKVFGVCGARALCVHFSLLHDSLSFGFYYFIQNSVWFLFFCNFH